jgi:hypothetical protein
MFDSSIHCIYLYGYFKQCKMQVTSVEYFILSKFHHVHKMSSFPITKLIFGKVVNVLFEIPVRQVFFFCRYLYR